MFIKWTNRVTTIKRMVILVTESPKERYSGTKQRGSYRIETFTQVGIPMPKTQRMGTSLYQNRPLPKRFQYQFKQGCSPWQSHWNGVYSHINLAKKCNQDRIPNSRNHLESNRQASGPFPSQKYQISGYFHAKDATKGDHSTPKSPKSPTSQYRNRKWKHFYVTITKRTYILKQGSRHPQIKILKECDRLN